MSYRATLTPAFHNRSVTVSVGRAHLRTAGPLLCDPYIKMVGMAAGSAEVPGELFDLGCTTPQRMTSEPVFNQTFTIDPLAVAISRIRIEMWDAKVEHEQRFMGQCVLPVGFDVPSESVSASRVMLVARNDPINAVSDVQALQNAREEDFGYVEVEWRVDVRSCGGVLLSESQKAASSRPSSSQGTIQGASHTVQHCCLLSATFIPPAVPQADVEGTMNDCVLIMRYGSNKRWPIPTSNTIPSDYPNPKYTASKQLIPYYPESTPIEFYLRPEGAAAHDVSVSNISSISAGSPQPSNAPQLGGSPHEIVFQLCRSDSALDGRHLCYGEVVVPLNTAVLDRDVMECYPFRPIGPNATNQMGAVMVQWRLFVASPSSATCASDECIDINNPKHQLQFSHREKVWPQIEGEPKCPPGPLKKHMWESSIHIDRAKERRRRFHCIMECCSIDDVGHFYAVITRRVAGVADKYIPLVHSFYLNTEGNNKSKSDVQTDNKVINLTELLIGMAFLAQGVTIGEACRIAFHVLDENRTGKISVAAVAFIFEHMLLPATLDMSVSEVVRRVADIFGSPSDVNVITYREFQHYLVQNITLWHRLGCNVAPTLCFSRDALGGGLMPSSASNVTASNTDMSRMGRGVPHEHLGDEWRVFTVRLVKGGRGFRVTAHRDDSILAVQKTIASRIGIPPHRQSCSIDSRVVDPREIVAQVLTPEICRTKELSVQEKEDLVTLLLVVPTRNVEWEATLPLTEKVITLRAHVQQRINYPLSKIQLEYDGKVMWDRHQLDKYNVRNGGAVKVVVPK